MPAPPGRARASIGQHVVEQARRARQHAHHVERHDVAGAFPDRVDRRLAIVARQRRLLDIAVAAEALHRLVEQRRRDLADPVFDDRRHGAGKGRLAAVGRRLVEGSRQPERQRGGGGDVERHVGEHALHQRLVDQRLAEHLAVAGVVHRLGKPGPHQRRRGDGAVEPRQRHHVQDGRDAAPGSPTSSPMAPSNSTSDEALERLPSLSFSRWKRKPLLSPVAEQPRHQEAGEPLLRLRQHEEGVRHRRRHEPFVAGEAVEAGRLPAPPCVMLARTSVPPCFSVMPMPRVSPAFSTGGFWRLVVFARGHARRPFAEQLWARHQRRQRGVGHGHRAEMPAFELRRQVEARGPRPGAACRSPRRRFPRSRNAGRRRSSGASARDRPDGTRPGRCAALAVMRAAAPASPVGEPRQFLRLRRQHEAAERVEILLDRTRRRTPRAAPEAGRRARH